MEIKGSVRGHRVESQYSLLAKALQQILQNYKFSLSWGKTVDDVEIGNRILQEIMDQMGPEDLETVDRILKSLDKDLEEGAGK